MKTLLNQPLVFRITPELDDALDYLLKFEMLQRPLFPMTRSDLVRGIIADRYAEVKKLECPQCGQMTIPDEYRPGARFCANCAEPVLFSGDKNNGA